MLYWKNLLLLLSDHVEMEKLVLSTMLLANDKLTVSQDFESESLIPFEEWKTYTEVLNVFFLEFRTDFILMSEFLFVCLYFYTAFFSSTRLSLKKKILILIGIPD